MSKIKKVVAKKKFELIDQESGLSIKVSKGDEGELIGVKRAKTGYTVLINDKTLNLKDRKLLRYLFKID